MMRPAYPTPVASLGRNHFGLSDMLCNAWEWTQDCWHEDYTNAPYDGSAWLEKDGGNCAPRVVRGGLWIDNPQGLRSADRNWNNTDSSVNYLGFRIARVL